MAETEILELYELRYSDLKLLSSGITSSSIEEIGRLEKIKRDIMETLGPGGPGLLSVTGVTKASILRRELLPLARKLALLNPDNRKLIFKDHGLGSDVPLKNPDRNVSSFAMQLKYEQSTESSQSKSMSRADDHMTPKEDYPSCDSMRHSPDHDFKNLGSTFKELGFCMMELGLCLARICDMALGGGDLENSLLESRMAKGRLIHYHSTLDELILREAEVEKGLSKIKSNHRSWRVQKELNHENRNSDKVEFCGTQFKLWQQWHYDYGVFTVLTDPLFLLSSQSQEYTGKDHGHSFSCNQECPSPSGHTYLQIFDPTRNRVRMVKSSPESFIIQVGESADILSKGRFRSTLHCVCKPEKWENLSRETFVVFLQPAWTKTFTVSDYPVENCNLDTQCSGAHDRENLYDEPHAANNLTEEIQKIIPPLSLRLKDGMTFAEFSRETTRQYYGGGGLQSNR